MYPQSHTNGCENLPRQSRPAPIVAQPQDDLAISESWLEHQKNICLSLPDFLPGTSAFRTGEVRFPSLIHLLPLFGYSAILLCYFCLLPYRYERVCGQLLALIWAVDHQVSWSWSWTLASWVNFVCLRCFLSRFLSLLRRRFELSFWCSWYPSLNHPDLFISILYHIRNINLPRRRNHHVHPS